MTDPLRIDGGVRLRCCIPFCRRTFRNDKSYTPWPPGAEVMCGKHWRMADKGLRARRKRLAKLYRKVETLIDPKSEKMADLLARWCHELWERAKRQATERAAGIA